MAVYVYENGNLFSWKLVKGSRANLEKHSSPFGEGYILYQELFLPWLMERAWEVARGHPKGLPHAGEPPGDPEDTHQRLVRRGRQILKKTRLFWVSWLCNLINSLCFIKWQQVKRGRRVGWLTTLPPRTFPPLATLSHQVPPKSISTLSLLAGLTSARSRETNAVAQAA